MNTDKKEEDKNSGNTVVPKDSTKKDEKGKTEVKNASASGLGSIQRPDGEKEKPENKNY